MTMVPQNHAGATPPYGLPGAMRVLAREFGAAIDAGDYRHAETIRFAINALAESKPPAPARHLEVIR